jgi:DNA-binding transcriptional LysR family regulator
MSDVWDLRKLRLLRELQQRGTIAAVASALRYSPSTISQQLSQLERDVGMPLLEPEGRNVRLTAQGEALAGHAARALDLEEEMRGRLESVGGTPAPVRIAALQTTALALIPAAISILRASAPELRVEVSVVPPEHGLFELEARGFDLALAEQYPGHTREHRDAVQRELLGSDPIRLAVGRRSPITRLSDTAGMPWVMEPSGTAARLWAIQQCRAAGFEPDVRFEAADVLAHAQLIAAGHAVGLLPDLVRTEERSIRLIDLPGDPHRRIFTSVRGASAGRPGVRAARDALAEAFTTLRGS